MVNSLLGCSDQASVKVACFYLTPKQDDFNKSPEIQVCIAEALYDVGSIVARWIRRLRARIAQMDERRRQGKRTFLD